MCETCRDKQGIRHQDYDESIRNKRDKKYKDFYHSTEWIKTRMVVLIRDNGLCQHCLKKEHITKADMVHHIVEVKVDWNKRLELSNLISLCNSCHNKVHGNG
jgi:5-methylcytosine-specific restriction protein A